MSAVLSEYPSKSNPNKRYQIIKGGDGVIYCNCPSWAFSKGKKACKHLNEFMTHGSNEDVEWKKLVDEIVEQLRRR